MRNDNVSVLIPELVVSSQGGALHGPSDQASQRGGIVQVGGENPGGRTEGHACHRANARQTRLRPPC